ncbi:hypothetical protein Tco_0195035 [Tanacetum coccineum]
MSILGGSRQSDWRRKPQDAPTTAAANRGPKSLREARAREVQLSTSSSHYFVCEVFGGGKNNHFAGLEEFRQRVEELLEKQEEKLRKLSIEYDEELYPHMLSAIAEPCGGGNCHEKKLLDECLRNQVPEILIIALMKLVVAMETMKLLSFIIMHSWSVTRITPIDLIMAVNLASMPPEALEAQPDYFLSRNVGATAVPILCLSA